MTEALEVRARPRRLTRSGREKMIAGVCGGLAEYFALDPTLVRIGYIAISILPVFPGIIAYIILMFVMPPPESDAA